MNKFSWNQTLLWSKILFLYFCATERWNIWESLNYVSRTDAIKRYGKHRIFLGLENRSDRWEEMREHSWGCQSLNMTVVRQEDVWERKRRRTRWKMRQVEDTFDLKPRKIFCRQIRQSLCDTKCSDINHPASSTLKMEATGFFEMSV
jgi:hypothetical protein